MTRLVRTLMVASVAVLPFLTGCERDPAAVAYAQTPHVIREADGCKVYAFMANDYWHYFTRCGDEKVSTEGHHGERVGKSTRDVAETIDTQEDK